MKETDNLSNVLGVDSDNTIKPIKLEEVKEEGFNFLIDRVTRIAGFERIVVEHTATGAQSIVKDKFSDKLYCIKIEPVDA